MVEQPTQKPSRLKICLPEQPSMGARVEIDGVDVTAALHLQEIRIDPVYAGTNDRLTAILVVHPGLVELDLVPANVRFAVARAISGEEADGGALPDPELQAAE